jgi:hypothetical protein
MGGPAQLLALVARASSLSGSSKPYLSGLRSAEGGKLFVVLIVGTACMIILALSLAFFSSPQWGAALGIFEG